MDLPIGEARLKLGGGHGGHNGLRDTITHIGADFWRLRVGVGHPGDKSQVIDYVLRRAGRDEENVILDAIARALDVLPVFVEQGAEKAMNKLHTKQT
jgi:PTH1 family peptidyl-tRNA hydrolase